MLLFVDNSQLYYGREGLKISVEELKSSMMKYFKHHLLLRCCGSYLLLRCCNVTCRGTACQLPLSYVSLKELSHVG